jgi:hypothetical protein
MVLLPSKVLPGFEAAGGAATAPVQVIRNRVIKRILVIT